MLRCTDLGEVKHVVHPVTVLLVGVDADVCAAGFIHLRRLDWCAAEHPREVHRKLALATLIKQLDVVKAFALVAAVKPHCSSPAQLANAGVRSDISASAVRSPFTVAPHLSTASSRAGF